MTIGHSDDELLAFASAAQFHQSLFLPATPSHGSLRVTFAVVGLLEESAPTMLWLGGMFGTRYDGLSKHHMATTMGVRLVYCDRPGMGGSTPVALENRINVWLETVPILMSHLNASRVALGCHSAGTVYLLNTMFYLPHILSHKHAYVAMAAPWVSTKDSGVSSMAMAKKIPDSLFVNWNRISVFIRKNIVPAAGSSSGVLESVLKPFHSESWATDQAAKETEAEAVYGMPSTSRKFLAKHVNSFVIQEDSTGANSEALLCLKKGAGTLWGVADDYEHFVPELLDVLKARFDNNLTDQKCTFHAFFAESDSLVGKKGQQYFDQCWTTLQTQDIVDYKSFLLPGTDHDSVCQPENGMFERIFKEMKRENAPLSPEA
ncbi:hypothetical protein PVAG01_02091 [Phlyctema vagabunda]|uniref:AB hydrolase-1 domain-containing protein n=1 Tax=Phlyctema vagabunda TaxID=108571 RepID=A0ABR4PPU6_9HELO